ncbi:MAG: DEAD/DEAH box helicase [Methanobacteriota archaeon]|nr:MAG: DEAD/DEAH box helicase [Euryarchaeota archaeon]
MNEMQTQAILKIQSGSQLLVVAPTGSGKTEAALFPVLEALGADDREGIRALYVTPLRALNRNLIDRVLRLVASTKLTAAVRHGDTPPSERRKQAANPPDILITTPETLQAILPGKRNGISNESACRQPSVIRTQSPPCLAGRRRSGFLSRRSRSDTNIGSSGRVRSTKTSRPPGTSTSLPRRPPASPQSRIPSTKVGRPSSS